MNEFDTCLQSERNFSFEFKGLAFLETLSRKKLFLQLQMQKYILIFCICHRFKTRELIFLLRF